MGRKLCKQINVKKQFKTFYHVIIINFVWVSQKSWTVWDIHQGYKNKNTETKNPWHDCLIGYIPELIKKWWNTRLWDFLRQIQPRIIVKNPYQKCLWTSKEAEKTIRRQNY